MNAVINICAIYAHVCFSVFDELRVTNTKLIVVLPATFIQSQQCLCLVDFCRLVIQLNRCIMHHPMSTEAKGVWFYEKGERLPMYIPYINAYSDWCAMATRSRPSSEWDKEGQTYAMMLCSAVSQFSKIYRLRDREITVIYTTDKFLRFEHGCNWID